MLDVSCVWPHLDVVGRLLEAAQSVVAEVAVVVVVRLVCGGKYG